MYKNALAYGFILTILFIQSDAAFAADRSKSQPEKDKTSIELQRDKSQQLAPKMMGHINLAQFALDMNLPDEAYDHIKKAQNIQIKLAAQFPGLKIDSSFKYGKVMYGDSHAIKELYVPVLDDILLISGYETTFQRSEEMGLKETNAGLVRMIVKVDLTEVKASLDAALQDINNKQYSKALNVLTAIFEGAILDEEEIEDPILAISGNLALAKAFLSKGQYDKARFTLNYLQDRLNAGFPGVDTVAVEKLSADFDQLQVALKKKDPTITQSISDRFDQWKKTVKEWVANPA